MPATPLDPLATPLQTVRGVGPERTAQLARLGLATVGDLLLHRPRRYEDRRHFQPIRALTRDEAAITRGGVVALGVKRFRHGTRSMFELILDDGTGRLHCRWWNLPYLQNYFQMGDEVLVYGKLSSLAPRAMDHPETEVVEGCEEPSIHLNRIVPVYPLTEGLSQRWLRALVWQVLAEVGPLLAQTQPGLTVPDLPDRARAIPLLHFPEELSDAESARQRLALEEFFELQLEIQRRKNRLLTGRRGLPCAGDNRLIKPFLKRLGFALTGAQAKVLQEIRRDLGSGRPMRRLLQGDVGCGKTVVAASAALMVVESGFCVALMAPTEILAEQHFQTFADWFMPLGVDVRLYTGRRTVAGSRAGRLGGPSGSPPSPAVTIGTHALIEGGVELDNLGLAIIDEQHKFGVAQRERLVRKGWCPHVLVMTATPIPRTLGLTIYGDLEMSVIDQIPAGRRRVRTFVRGPDKLPEVWAFIRAKLAGGHQAYVVYPRIAKDDASGLKAVTKECQQLGGALAPFRVGLLHGRLGLEERARVMDGFRANAIQVLVATTVIEVGLHVPRATLLVVENAEQFGLAQLHQLRGRVGRSGGTGWCILITRLGTREAEARLRILAETNDGFRIAEADLERRGPGEFLGRPQSGRPPFRFGNLSRDGDLIERARRLAAERGTEQG